MVDLSSEHIMPSVELGVLTAMYISLTVALVKIALISNQTAWCQGVKFM
jgi:hypothetical protein